MSIAGEREGVRRTSQFIIAPGRLGCRTFLSVAALQTAEDIRSPKYLLDIFFDMIGNTALFFPLGYFLSRLLTSSSPSQRWLLAAGIGGTLSLGIEFYQVYCHNRFPSIFDVITNVIGTLMGVHFSLFRKTVLPARPNPNVTPNPQNRSHTP